MSTRKYKPAELSTNRQRIAIADKSKDSHEIGWPHYSRKGACMCNCGRCIGKNGCICYSCSGIGHSNCKRAKVNSDGSPKAA